MADYADDEQLLAALREAMKARRVVPPQFIETAKSAYAWHNIDAELARLTYDSSRESDRSVSLRSETASIRAMTFTSARLSIELEVTGDALIGQVLPPAEGTVEAQAQSGATTVAPADEIGCFVIEPIPVGPFRLHCRIQGGADVVTGWITL